MLVLTACQSRVETADEYAGWKSYENADIGISFKYPEGEVELDDKTIPNLDTGKKVHVTVKGASMALTSADYTQGVGEGCCYYYSGNSLDMSLNDADAKAEIEKQFGEIYSFERRAEFGGFSFIRLSRYVSVHPVYTVLIPFEQGGDYANILLSGPGMGNFIIENETGWSKPDMAGALDYINNQKYKEDVDYQNKVAVFEKIVSSLKLT